MTLRTEKDGEISRPRSEILNPSPPGNDFHKIKNPHIRYLREKHNLGIIVIRKGSKLPATEIPVPGGVEVPEEYTERGKLKLPQGGSGKRKRDPDFTSGFVDKTITDVDFLNTCFPETPKGKAPRNNWAVVGGAVPNCQDHWWLDLDVKDDVNGIERFKAYLKEHDIPWPKTLTIKTGGGGLHLGFKKRPGEHVPSRNGVLGKGSGVDIKADGGYVVGAGSVHASGNSYEVIEDVEMAYAHEKLLELALSKRPAGRSKPKSKSTIGSTAGGADGGVDGLSDEKYAGAKKPDWLQMKAHCPAADMYEEFAGVMPQEPWALFAGAVARTEGGVEIFHQISSVYPTYDFDEAQMIVDRALEPKGAITCEAVANLELLGEACENCPIKDVRYADRDEDGKVMGERGANPMLVGLLPPLVLDHAFIKARNVYMNIVTRVSSVPTSFARTYRSKMGSKARLNDLDTNPFFMKVETESYNPTAGTYIKRDDGQGYDLNTYIPSKLKRVAGEPTLFLRHIHRMLEDDYANILLDFLAWQVQNPGAKMSWALTIVGPPGCGKSYLAELMRALLGDDALHDIKSKNLDDRFNKRFAECALVIIDELQHATGFDVAEIIKEFITKNVMLIEPKGKDAGKKPVFFNIIMFSNHDDHMDVDRDDRRHCVLKSYAAKTGEKEPYFDQLWNDLRNVEEMGKVLNFLMDRDLFNFDAMGHAPETVFKTELVKDGEPAYIRELRKMKEKREGIFCRELATFDKFKEWLKERQDQALGISNAVPDTVINIDNAISSLMSELGMVKIEQMRFGGSAINIWSAHEDVEYWQALKPAERQKRLIESDARKEPEEGRKQAVVFPFPAKTKRLRRTPRRGRQKGSTK